MMIMEKMWRVMKVIEWVMSARTVRSERDFFFPLIDEGEIR